MHRWIAPLLLVPFFMLLTACSEEDNPSSNNNVNDQIDLVINEFLAKNDSLNIDEHGEFDDWIEIYNRGAVSVDLAGYTLTDNPSNPTKWRIPDSSPELTEILPGDYLLIWADGDTLQGSLHASFSLNDDGEAIGLFSPDGKPVDLVHFAHQYPNVSMGRSPSGGSGWTFLREATPGAANSAPADNLAPVILDVMRLPSVPREGQAVQIAVEAYDDGGIESVVLFREVGGGGFDAMPMTASEDRWEIFVPGQARGVVVRYYVTVTDSQGLSVNDPYFAPANSYSYTVPDTEYAPPIFINEFLASNGDVNRDEVGDFDDWIELHNTGSEAINLAGMYLSDTPSDPFLYQFPMDNPAATTILAGGYLLIWADDETNEGALHANFKLSASGESILLHASDQNQNVMIDSYTFGNQQENISEGRLPNGSSNWVFFSTPTPGVGNAP